jgi:hypothetical protein
MDMIGHERVGEDARAGVGEVLAEESEVEFAVGEFEEDRLAIRTALSDVVGDSACDDPRVSGHSADSAVWRREFSRGHSRVVRFRVAAQVVPVSAPGAPPGTAMGRVSLFVPMQCI